jgi:hypothetical protein
MKKLLGVIALFALIFQACEGPMGPQGPQGPQGEQGQQGPQGQPGDSFVGLAYEVGLDFTAENDYFEVLEFPEPLVESDIVLTFINWETFDGVRVWRLLPQMVFFEEGFLRYNYDFTEFDIALFLETNFDPEILDDSWKLDVGFRIVVLPVDFANGRLDLSDMDELLRMTGIQEKDFIKLERKVK